MCLNLITSFKHKFKWEIDSPIYNVANLLNVSKLLIWIDRVDCKEVKRIAIDNLIEVATSFLKEKTQTSSNSSTTTLPTQASTSAACSHTNRYSTGSEDSLYGMQKDDDYCDLDTNSIIF